MPDTRPEAAARPPEANALSAQAEAEALVFPKVKKRRTGPYAADDCGGEPPAMFLKGIHEFNEGEFFEQHETLETLWRLTASDIRYLYQGVLLIGVGFYHLEQNNFHGTQAKLAAGVEMLEWFAPACQSVDVADLIIRARPCLEQVRQLGRERLQEFDRTLIPQVKLLGRHAHLWTISGNSDGGADALPREAPSYQSSALSGEQFAPGRVTPLTTDD